MGREGAIPNEEIGSSILFAIFMTFMMTPSALILGLMQDDRLCNDRMILVSSDSSYMIDDIVKNLNDAETKDVARSLLVTSDDTDKSDVLRDIYHITHDKFPVK